MLNVLSKSENLLKKFSKLCSISFDNLATTLEESINKFRLSWLLVDKFGFERKAINWLMFSPGLLGYLIKKKLFGKFNKGKEAEIRAAEYLSSIGLEILLMNYRSPNGELDIISVDNNFFRFIEVKSSYTSIIQPEERINKNKVNKILTVSEDFLVELGLSLERRYDVIAVGCEGLSYLHDYLI